MPKERKWNTGIKHLGTILWSPVKYYRYKKFKDAFVQDDHLQLHNDYAAEPVDPIHRYPGALGHDARTAGVIYPGQAHDAQAVIPRQTDLMHHAVFDHQADLGVAQDQRGEDKGNLVVLRGNQLLSAKKRGDHNDLGQPNVGRTQHTTLSGGNPVASAAIIEGNQLKMLSGHYRPDHDAAVKLAIFGKQSETLSGGPPTS